MNFYLFTLICCFCVSEGRIIGDEEWDHLIFTIMWPQASCLKENSTDQISSTMQSHHGESLQHNTCVIPQNTNSWTIHGLWPTKGTSEKPNFCPGAPSFNPDALKSIENDLDQWWPNLFINTEKFNFWRHEWLKHGSCSYKLPSLNSEFKYFNHGLSLLHSLNMDSHLASSGIVPSSTKTYQIENISAALESSLKTHVGFYCFSKHQWDQQYLLQMEVCMNKDLQLIYCPSKQKLLQDKLNLLVKIKNKMSIKLSNDFVNHNDIPLNVEPLIKDGNLKLYNLFRNLSLDLLSFHLQNKLDDLNSGSSGSSDGERLNGLQVGLCTQKPIIYLPIVH